MPLQRGLRRALHIAAVLATASASSIRPNWIFEREDTCASGFNKCSQAGLPDNFCCEGKSTCMVLAGGTTVLCCPEGNQCDDINSIACDVGLQDATRNPTAEVKTTALNVKLESCGAGCCPFGYTCNQDDFSCQKDADQSIKPGEPKPSPSSTPSTKPSETDSPTDAPSTSVVNGGVASGELSTGKPEDHTVSNNMNTAAIVGGVVGGLVAILAAAGAVILMRHKRKKRLEQSKRHDSDASFGNIISAPMPHAELGGYTRNDFLSKAQSSSVATTPTLAQERFPPSSPYAPYAGRPDSEMSDAPRSYHPSAEVGGLRNLTDWSHRYSGATRSSVSSSPLRDRRQHSAGSESINIFADPLTVGSGAGSERGGEWRDSTATTWAHFQQSADTRVPESPVRRR
ncbi:hypothetical protein F4778DRAFT_225927 [Xylariomycetidae sp. FL2044]|nr:hypothetical protein F4778DRAFT_225927 [Xylariomycetidae sp. FL2044]